MEDLLLPFDLHASHASHAGWRIVKLTLAKHDQVFFGQVSSRAMRTMGHCTMCMAYEQ